MKNKFDKLKEANTEKLQEFNQSIKKLDNIQNESQRVAKIALNANIIISDLDKQFESATRLQKMDIAFLFLATGLQIVRQYILANSSNNYLDKNNRLTDKEASGNKAIDRSTREKRYYHTTVAEIMSNPVPFDTQNGSSNLEVDLGGGKYHRMRTVGHDPILGWIFGTANIATRTMTTFPLFRSYHIKYDHFNIRVGELSQRKNDYIDSNADTGKVINYGIVNRINHPIENNNISILVHSLIMEAIHLKSDWSSKQSLSLPFVGLDVDLAKRLTDVGINVAAIKTISEQAIYAEMINFLVILIHKMLVFGSTEEKNQKLIEIRSNKIVTYSNLIASGTNAVYVAATKDFKSLDIGGFLISLYRLITSISFQNKVKEEFLEKEFYNIVMNE